MTNPATPQAAAQPEWPSNLGAILDLLEASLLDRGVQPKQAREAAESAVTNIAAQLGGRMIYLPKGERLRLAIRNRRIWHQFNGSNIAALAARHGLSEMQIRNVLAQQRKLQEERDAP